MPAWTAPTRRGSAVDRRTPFGLINDTQRRVNVILDEEMLESEWGNFHPLHNAASTTLSSTDLLRFVRALGYEPIIV